MIPRTFPSSVASNGSTQMIVYFLPSVSGLTRWVDYIPVKFTTVATAATENTYNQNGYIPVVSLSSIAGATPFKEYVPVFLDSSAADADVWDVTITGFIPVGTAGIGGAALYLDFAATTSLDRRITFSRTTNATVTGSNGLIQNAPMNLLTFSEQFDNAAWMKTNVTVTANSITAPDGTTTADKIAISAATAVTAVAQNSPGVAFSIGAVTVTAYVKADGVQYANVGLLYSAGVFSGTQFDLSSGTVVRSASAVYTSPSGTITPVGNGWYRCTHTVTTTTTTIYPLAVPSNALWTTGEPRQTLTGDGTSGIYLWGAQLELGSTATTYNPTTVKNLLGFTEHFDNAAWTKSNAFVQTNLLTYSQDFDNAAWAKLNSAVTANAATAPDGSQTGAKLVESATTGFHYFSRGSGITTVSGTQYVYSLYCKAGERNWIYLKSFGGFPSGDAYVNLTTGAIGTTTGGLVGITTANMGGGWWRISTPALLGTGITANIEWYTATANGTSSYTGDGTSGLFIWGAQLVQGTSAGDYKATYAAAAAVGYTDIYGQPFAQKLVENTSASTHSVAQTTTVINGGVYTATAYVKAAERTFVGLYAGTPGQGIIFNLTLGTVHGSLVAPPTASSIVAQGNGWYRISILYTASSTGTAPSLYVCDDTGAFSYTGNGTSGIYIFGAQLSDSASVDPYVYNPVAAPSSTAYYGPRFDYDPVTLAPKGLLIEEQRTNLLTYSEQFNDASYTKVNATVTANTAVAPDGTVTADLITYSASGLINGSFTAAASSAVTYSVYAKAGTATSFRIREGFYVGTAATFNLTNGTVTSGAGVIQNAGNGWYRCSLTHTSGVGQTIGSVVFDASAGVGTVLLWGAQVETGAFATSYIPTVASQATRAADSASMIGNNFARWYNAEGGTVYSEFSRDSTSGASRGVWAINSGATNNAIDYRPNGSNCVVQVSGATQADIYPGGGTAGAVVKNAFAFRLNDFAASTNAGTVQTDTSGSLPIASQMQVGGLSTSAGQLLCGTIKRITYYPRRLANSELIGITS